MKKDLWKNYQDLKTEQRVEAEEMNIELILLEQM